ncbi:hypothetical protein ACFUTX_03570 [Microbacterium sp. NPDC057407]|uniref:hypothetical protein n=1 Tax=Microbacterium sp. NPDC057407 TaxID=3346120 RepID=UPI00366AE9D6
MNTIDLLELRIHGIANSPPAAALLATDEEIERADGDMQGSFWRIKRPTGFSVTAASAEASGDPHEPMPTAEAYWWGNQARTGGTGLALVGRVIVHIGWLLVLPFGLCNLAYWARRDIKGEVETPELWHSGDGAGLIRVFALLQTLFYTVGLLAVSVHLIGIQCFPAPEDDGPVEVCAALPGFLNFLVDLTPNARAALLAVVPIAVILFLYVVSRRARAGFHPLTSFDEELVGSPVAPTDASAPAASGAEVSGSPGAASGAGSDGGADAGSLLGGSAVDGPGEASDVDDSSAPPRPALLGSVGFWQRPRTAEAAERTHLAAVFAFVVMTLSVDAVLDATGLGLTEVWLQGSSAWREAPFPAVMALVGGGLVLCTVALAWGGALSGRMTAVRVRRGLATWLMVASIVAFAVWLSWAFFVDSAAPVPPPNGAAADGLSGMVVAPTVIAAVGALIALASLSWGYGRGIQVVCGVLILGALGFAVVATLRADDPDATNLMTYIAAGLVIAAVIASYAPLLVRENRTRARYAGWRGNGAAVALLSAWFASLVITSLLVLGVYSWLSTPSDSTATRAFLRTVRDAITNTEAEDTPVIELPVFYSRFATMLVVILTVVIIAAVLAMIGGLRKFPAFSVPGLMFPDDLRGEDLALQKDRDGYYGGVGRIFVPGSPRSVDATEPCEKWRTEAVSVDDYPTFEHRPGGRLREVASARRVAGLAQRGEPILFLLSVLTAAALLVLGIPTLGSMLAEFAVWERINALSGWALGLLALAAVGWVVANAVTSDERPLGLVWDIVCFFPRAGHPFTAPCYAERAVPEVAKRVRHHIDDSRRAGRDPQVILSAHSMGATIAVAVIFMLGQEDDDRVKAAMKAGLDPARVDRYVDRVALLTHGVQLRAYFSRFFPEVFGHRVLGTRGTRGPALVRADPWEKQVIEEAKHPYEGFGPDEDPVTVVRLLGGAHLGTDHAVQPRWRSLWRRTDFLGFPVHGYASNVVRDHDGTCRNENLIDRGATERSPQSYLWRIARHDNYLSTAQYRAARDELVAMLRSERPKIARQEKPTSRREAAGRQA